MSLSFFQHLKYTAETGVVEMLHVDLTASMARHRVNGGTIQVNA